MMEKLIIGFDIGIILWEAVGTYLNRFRLAGSRRPSHLEYAVQMLRAPPAPATINILLIK